MAKKKTKETVVNGSLEEVRKQIRKEFGDNTVRIYTEPVKRPTISTGIISLDKALGGGVPQGRMIELLGDPSSGKSTLALSIAANAQRLHEDMNVVYVDTEHALDTVWAADKLGINLSRFDHVEPEFAEDAIFTLEAYLRTGQVSIGVLDSVAALLPKTEMDNDIGDANIGLQARLVASAMKRINSLLNKHPKTTLIFINQKRARIGGGPASFAFEATKSTGGKALPFYMTTRLNVVKIQSIRDSNKNEVGQLVLVDVLKNKVNNGPGSKITFRIDNTHGIDTAQELLEWAIEEGRVNKNSSWYELVETEEKVQGEDAIKEIIRTKFVDEWLPLALG